LGPWIAVALALALWLWTGYMMADKTREGFIVNQGRTERALFAMG